MICAPLIGNISLNYLFACMLSDSIRVITAGPKRTSPKFFFYLRVQPEYLTGSYTLYNRHYPCHCQTRNTLDQKMNVIALYSYFNKMKLISLTYTQANYFQPFIYLICEDFSSIFCRKNKMIQKKCLIMTLEYMITHRITIAPNPMNYSTQGSGN